eukprot:35160_1
MNQRLHLVDAVGGAGVGGGAELGGDGSAYGGSEGGGAHGGGDGAVGAGDVLDVLHAVKLPLSEKPLLLPDGAAPGLNRVVVDGGSADGSDGGGGAVGGGAVVRGDG